MATQFLRSASVQRIRPESKALASVWLYAAILFALGSGFAFVLTGKLILIPAVAFATVLGGLMASLKVWLSNR